MDGRPGKIIRSRCWDKVSKKGVDGEHKFKIKDIFDNPTRAKQAEA